MNNEELHLMGNRIHSLMTELKLKNVEVADQISVSKVSVGKWRNGEVQPSGSNFSALVKVLRTTPDYLLSGSGPKQYISIEDRNDNLIFMPSISLDSNASLHTDDFQIAHYDKVILTANDKGREVHRQSNDKVCISNLSANIAGASVADSFSYLIEDDGMSDRVLDGARCVADASKTEIKDGKIYCFRHGIIRRTRYLYRRSDGGLLLRAHNPAYPEEIVKPEDIGDIEVLGWVWQWLNTERW